MIAKHEAPTVRLPVRLPSKTLSPREKIRRPVTTPATMDEDETADGILDRTQVKNMSINVTKKAQKLRADEGKLLVTN